MHHEKRTYGICDSVEPVVNVIPEKRMLAAVLHRAIMDCLSNTEGDIKRTARGWLYCKSIEVMSARWVCDNLDIDHEKLINKLAENRKVCNSMKEAIQNYRKSNKVAKNGNKRHTTNGNQAVREKQQEAQRGSHQNNGKKLRIIRVDTSYSGGRANGNISWSQEIFCCQVQQSQNGASASSNWVRRCEEKAVQDCGQQAIILTGMGLCSD
jgi:hypothetical protein